MSAATEKQIAYIQSLLSSIAVSSWTTVNNLIESIALPDTSDEASQMIDALKRYTTRTELYQYIVRESKESVFGCKDVLDNQKSSLFLYAACTLNKPEETITDSVIRRGLAALDIKFDKTEEPSMTKTPRWQMRPYLPEQKRLLSWVR